MDDDTQNPTAVSDAAPDTSTPSTPDARDFDAGAQPSPTPSASSPASGTPPVSAPDAVNSRPAVSLVPAPNVVKPAKRGGLAGVVDEIADTVAGTTGPGKVYKDAQGNEYIEHPTLSRKGQWLKIASEALHGAAAGAAQMQGPGAAGRGLAAGVNAGDKMAADQRQQDQQQSQEVRQANEDTFNGVMRKHELAAKEFELQRMKIAAGENDVKYAQDQIDREGKLGSADLGTVANEADLADKMSKQEGFWKNVHKNDIVAIPELGPKGERLGLHVFQRTPGIGNQMVDPGTPIRVWDVGKHDTVEQVPTVPMTHNQVDAYNNTADNQKRQWHIDQNEAAFKEQQTQTSEAEEEAHRATARKTNAETAGEGPSNPALIDAIGKGSIAPESLSRMLGGKQGEKLLADVAAAHPDLDTSRLASYPKTYADFTSGKTALQRQNMDNAFKAVDDLTKLNTYSSRLPVGPARTAWDNRLNAASQEIANGLAKPGTGARESDVKGVHTALSPIFSRQAAIDKQIDSLMDAYGSMRTRWQEAAPSPAYEARMPDVGPQTKAIIYRHDPVQAEQWFGKPAFATAPGKPRVMSFDGGKTWQPAPQQ